MAASNNYTRQLATFEWWPFTGSFSFVQMPFYRQECMDKSGDPRIETSTVVTPGSHRNVHLLRVTLHLRKLCLSYRQSSLVHSKEDATNSMTNSPACSHYQPLLHASECSHSPFPCNASTLPAPGRAEFSPLGIMPQTSQQWEKVNTKENVWAPMEHLVPNHSCQH